MVVFFDIDGTIIDEKTQQIPESAVKAIKKLSLNGHIPVVNTGRPYSHLDPRVLSMDFRGWVCGCGMDIRLNGEQIYRAAPDAELCRYSVGCVERFGMLPIYEAENGIVYMDRLRDGHPYIDKERRVMRQKGCTVADINDVPEPVFQKFVTFDGPGCDRAGFIAAMEPYYTCTVRDGSLLEMVLKGCSKAQGMEYFLRYLGIGRGQVLAVGDSTNDLPMFSIAAHTVCLGDGMEELKAAAEYVTAPVLEDGLQKALAHYGLI